MGDDQYTISTYQPPAGPIELPRRKWTGWDTAYVVLIGVCGLCLIVALVILWRMT